LVPASRSGTCKAATGSGSGDFRVSGPNTSESLRSGTCSGDREREEARSGCRSSRSGSTTSDCEGSGTRIGGSSGSGEAVARGQDPSDDISESFANPKEVPPSNSDSVVKDSVSRSIFHKLADLDAMGGTLRAVGITSEACARSGESTG